MMACSYLQRFLMCEKIPKDPTMTDPTEIEIRWLRSSFQQSLVMIEWSECTVEMAKQGRLPVLFQQVADSYLTAITLLDQISDRLQLFQQTHDGGFSFSSLHQLLDFHREHVNSAVIFAKTRFGSVLTLSARFKALSEDDYDADYFHRAHDILISALHQSLNSSGNGYSVPFPFLSSSSSSSPICSSQGRLCDFSTRPEEILLQLSKNLAHHGFVLEKLGDTRAALYLLNSSWLILYRVFLCVHFKLLYQYSEIPSFDPSRPLDSIASLSQSSSFHRLTTFWPSPTKLSSTSTESRSSLKTVPLIFNFLKVSPITPESRICDVAIKRWGKIIDAMASIRICVSSISLSKPAKYLCLCTILYGLQGETPLKPVIALSLSENVRIQRINPSLCLKLLSHLSPIESVRHEALDNYLMLCNVLSDSLTFSRDSSLPKWRKMKLPRVLDVEKALIAMPGPAKHLLRLSGLGEQEWSKHPLILLQCLIFLTTISDWDPSVIEEEILHPSVASVKGATQVVFQQKVSPLSFL